MPSPTHLLVPLLAPLLLAGPPHATRARDDDRVSFEIVETAKGAKHRTRLELPANGKIEAWTEEGAESRFCQVESEIDRSRARRKVHLKCKRSPATAIADLDVEAEPPVDVRGRLVLADIERPDGLRIEVAMKTS